MHLAKLAAAARLVWRLRCSGWRREVGRLRRTPSHSRALGRDSLLWAPTKRGRRAMEVAEATTLNGPLRGPAEDTQCRAPDQLTVKATPSGRPNSRPALTVAGGAHACNASAPGECGGVSPWE